MIILLFGPPGCGKGTQASFLVQNLKIPAISTGEMFRAECGENSALSVKIRSILASGGLIGDDIVNAMVAQRIARPDCARGFLLDGFPRTLEQARYFSGLLRERGLPAPLVIHLEVPAENLVKRLTARRQCPTCHRIYNLLTQPPAKDGVCDADGAKLITREDDRESVIRERLRAYQKSTGPVLDWYGKDHVVRVDGSLPPAEVSARIEQLLVAQPAV
jgi:adenylate kinase